jgi:hypothetical protein
VSVQFTALYDWLARRRDLNSTEKIIIAHILRYGKSGCSKSNKVFAREIGMDRSTFIRAKKQLIQKEILALTPERRPVMFVNENMIEKMPVFDYVKGCGKPVKSSAGNDTTLIFSLKKWWRFATSLLVSGGVSPPLFKQFHKKLDETKETKEISDFLDYRMKQRNRTLPTSAEINKRRNEQKQRLLRK